VLVTVETRLFPAVTTAPADVATEVSVPLFRLFLAAVRLEPRVDKALDRALIWGENWPCASDLTVFRLSWIFVNWSEIAERPFAVTFVCFRSDREVLRLATLEQRAGLLVLVLVLPALALMLLVLSALALALVLLLVALVLLLLLQPARNAAAATHATASPLHCLAIMPAECRIRVLAASPAPGEGQRG